MSNISDFPDDLRTHSHEEADTLIILHAIDVAKKNPFTQLHLSCSDTDVFLLLLNYYQLICNSTIFRTKTRDIDVGSTYNNLGEEKCAALLGFHSFTGCHQTGKFSGFSKLSCWKTFVKSKPSVLEAFAKLGQENVDITNSSKIGKGLIDFVLDLYHHNRPAHVNNLQSLRWYLFSKFQLESKKLPPTTSALHHAICRSHCISNIWKQSHMKVDNITQVMIKLQFKLPQALISRGFTRRTVFHAPAFQQNKGINRLMDIYQIWKPKL